MLDLTSSRAPAWTNDDSPAYWRRSSGAKANTAPVHPGSTEFMSLPLTCEGRLRAPAGHEVLVAGRPFLRARRCHEPLTVSTFVAEAGIIGVSLAHRIANLAVTGVDVSAAAWSSPRATRNQGVADRVA